MRDGFLYFYSAYLSVGVGALVGNKTVFKA